MEWQTIKDWIIVTSMIFIIIGGLTVVLETDKFKIVLKDGTLKAKYSEGIFKVYSGRYIAFEDYLNPYYWNGKGYITMYKARGTKFSNVSYYSEEDVTYVRQTIYYSKGNLTRHFEITEYTVKESFEWNPIDPNLRTYFTWTYGKLDDFAEKVVYLDKNVKTANAEMDFDIVNNWESDLENIIRVERFQNGKLKIRTKVFEGTAIFDPQIILGEEPKKIDKIKDITDKLINQTLKDSLREDGYVRKEDKKTGKFITYDSDKKELLIEDSVYKDLLKIQLLTPYIVYVKPHNDVKIAELLLVNYQSSNISLFEKIYSFNTTNSYSLQNRTFNLKYKYIDENNNLFWINFTLLEELPHKNITIGLFTTIVGEEQMEWVPIIEGITINEWAGGMGDTTPPTITNINYSSTIAGELSTFTATLTDNSNILNYNFRTNNSGNIYQYNWSVSPLDSLIYAEVNITLNSTVGLSISYEWVAMDVVANSGSSGVFSLTTTSGSDSTAPTYSNNAHNTTLNGTSVLFSIDYNDDTALHPGGQYIFSTNNTGTWVNESAVNFTSTPSSANVSKTLNTSEGLSIGYRWYADDNANNTNDTTIFTLTTTEPSEDTCTYSGSGTWNIDCSDNCELSATDLGGEQININQSSSGQGNITFAGNVSNYGNITTLGYDSSNKCMIYCSSGGCFT